MKKLLDESLIYEILSVVEEGVEFKPNGMVDMKRFRWDAD